MNSMQQQIAILGFGFLIGLKHAIEADHLIAVTTMVSRERNPFKSALIGTFWGIGHTTILFVVGLLVLVLNISIPEKLSLGFEMIVGLMLIILGIGTIKNNKFKLHHHQHLHNHDIHSHLHLKNEDHKKINHTHKRSFIVGMVHGMAGSGTIMLLILTTIKSTVIGLYYILLFGLGSIIGMTMLSLLIGLPFAFSGSKFTRVEQKLGIIAGIISILFGLFLIYTVAAN